MGKLLYYVYLVTECHFTEVTLVGLYSEMDSDVPKKIFLKIYYCESKKYFLITF